MASFSSSISLSVRERLLLHLLPLQVHEADFEVPEDLTQAGIARCTGIARPNVSRAMKLMQDKGLVAEKLSHIKGHKRQKKIYLLSSDGVVQAKELRTSLGHLKLKLRTKKGEVEEHSVDELQQLLPGRPAVIDILNNLDENGECDFDKFTGRTAQEPGITVAEPGSELIEASGTAFISERGYVSMLEPLADIRHFFGRLSEQSAVNSWLEAPYPRVIMIYGIPGIGKTTFGHETVNYYRQRTNVMWYTLKDRDNLANVVKVLNEFLKEFGRTKLTSYIDSALKVEPAQAADIAAEELVGLPAILILDDFQNATDSIKSLFSAMLPLIQHHHELKLIVFSRQLVKFYDRRDVVIKNIVTELELEGDDHSDMHEFIHEEIFSKLSNSEQKLLEMASVHRQPVLAEAFFEEADITYTNIDSLVERSYLVRHGLNKFDTHDLIKGFFYSRLTAKERKRCHKLASQYYTGILSQWGTVQLAQNTAPYLTSVDLAELFPDAPPDQLYDALIEVQHHNLQCGEIDKAMMLSIAFGKGLIDAGRFDLITILDGYHLGRIDNLTSARLLGMKGEILTHLGDPTRMKTLQESLKKFGKRGGAGERALISTLIGENYAAVGNWKKAEKYHKQAKSILEGVEINERTAGDKLALARSYNNIGLALRNSGEHSGALDLYLKALRMLQDAELGTVQDTTAVLENIGLLMLQLKQPEEAGDYFKKALEALEEAGDDSGLAKLFATLGDIYVELGDIGTATDFFEKGVYYWERAEDMGHTLQTFLKFGQAYSMQVSGTDSTSQASYWNRIQRLFSDVREDDYRRISRLYDRIGSLYMHRGYWHKSLEFHNKALELFEKLNDNRALAKVYNNLGVLHRSRQESVKALECYKKAVVYLEKLNEPQGLAITYLNIGRLYERLDKPGESKEAYQKCYNAVGNETELQNLAGRALLGLARQMPAGNSARTKYLRDARIIFYKQNDIENLAEVKKLQAE
jgi:tetratricopeptide (TPR) repeat protein